MTPKILFLCPHNAAKSVIAVAYLEYLASQRGLDVLVDSAGTEPDAQVWPEVIELLQAAGIATPPTPPRLLTSEDTANATRIISMGCAVSEFAGASEKLESWDDVPLASENLVACRDAIRVRVEALAAELAANRCG